MRGSANFGKIRESLATAMGENFVSVTWSYTDGVQVRVRPETSPDAVESALASADYSGQHAVLTVPGDALSEKERLAIEEEMTTPKVLQALTDAGIFTTESDEYCGQITLVVEPDRSLDDARSTLAEALPLDRLEVRLATDADVAVDTVGRGDLQTTQAGGLQYRVIDGDNNSCTSAAPWYRNVSTPYGYYKEYYAITAGHCVNQSTWSSTPNDWNGVWWTVVTSNADLRLNNTTVATDPASIMYGAELDVAIWRLNNLYQAGAARSATNTDAHAYNWHNLGWWQWDPWNASSTSGGDAVGDWVCQSGYTTSFRAPSPPWNTNVIECGTLTTRNKTLSIGSPEASWFYRLRNSTTNVCTGDSGGTVWRSTWYSGIVKSGNGAISPVNGQECFANMTYSHVGWIPYGLNLDAPAQFS